MFAVGDETALELVCEARARRRARDWSTRYAIARTPEEAFTACEELGLWLEELAYNVCLDHEGEHCVGEALRDLRVVRSFCRQLIHQCRGRASKPPAKERVDSTVATVVKAARARR